MSLKIDWKEGNIKQVARAYHEIFGITNITYVISSNSVIFLADGYFFTFHQKQIKKRDDKIVSENKTKKMPKTEKPCVDKKDKYQWANHIRSLDVATLESLIEGLEGSIKLGIEVSRNTGYLEFAKEVLYGG